MLGGYLRGREGRMKSEELWWWTWPLSTHRSLLSGGHDNRWPVPLPTWHLHWVDQPDICRRVWGLSSGDVLWLGDRYAIICDVTTGTGILPLGHCHCDITVGTGVLPLGHYPWDTTTGMGVLLLESSHWDGYVTTWMGVLPLARYHWDGCYHSDMLLLWWVYYHWDVTTGTGMLPLTLPPG